MCCLFGLMDCGNTLTGLQKSRIISVLSRECEIRGTDATGIAYNSGDKLRIYKRPLPAQRMRFLIPGDASFIMGHTRMTTQGSERHNYNNHPFFGMSGNMPFALAHNGVLHNDLRLRHTLMLPKTKIQTDCYVAVQLLEHKDVLDLSSLKFMAEQVEGSFSFSVLDRRNNLFFVKGDNPLCIYHYGNAGLFIYASTEEILRSAITKLRLPVDKPDKLDISCGDILKISADGAMERGCFDADGLLRAWYSECMFTPYYFESGCSHSHVYEHESYVDELKSVAGAFGYSPADIDALLNEGFSPEELEEYFYCGEL